MKRLLVTLAVVSMLLALAGCAAKPAAAPAPQASNAMAPAAPAQPRAPAEGEAVASADFVQADAKRMIIKTVDLSMVVSDTAPSLESIRSLVSGMGGYVASSNSWREDEQLRAKVTVRVPADKLDAALAEIKKLAVRVQTENMNGQDVTEEYTDLNAQLTNLEATERELRELMGEVRQKTQKAEDILQVYRELETTRGEIERVKGRQQYLSEMTSLATLNIELIPDVLAKPVVEPGWRPLETVRDSSRQLVSAMRGLADVAIWLVIFLLPILIVIAIPIALLVLLIRWLARRGRRSRTAAA